MIEYVILCENNVAVPYANDDMSHKKLLCASSISSISTASDVKIKLLERLVVDRTSYFQ